MNYESETSVTIIRGDTWDGIQYTVTKTGTDYTGASVRAQFRDKPDGTIFRTKTYTPSSAIMSQIVFTVALTKDDSAAFTSEKAFCDVEIETAAGSRKTPIYIKFTVVKDLTRP